MKHIEQNEILSAVPLAPIMTRKDKLERWATLIKNHPDQVKLVHNLEHWGPREMDFNISYWGGCLHSTPFGLAVSDPIFRQLGLGNNVASVMDFFELTRSDLHDFSCDCGGSISNKQMARRIQAIADPTWKGFITRLFS